MSTLDINDRDALYRWALGFRTTLQDSNNVVEDMLRPPRERELGPVTHRDNCRDAHKALAEALEVLLKASAPAAPNAAD